MNALFHNSSLLALATIIGTIIGAGIFGLPYAIMQSGIVSGIFYFVLLGGVVLLLHLFFGEFALRTKEKHRLIGYADVYLGKWGKYAATIAIVFSIVGALLAYVIVGGEFLQTALSPVFSLSHIQGSLLFWGVLSLFIFRGIHAISKAELFMNIALFLAVGIIFLFALPHVEFSHYTMFNAEHIFLPYGVLLFAFAGWSAIPEIAELFKHSNDKKRLDNVIVAASVISLVLYALFTSIIIGVSGEQTSSEAMEGLVPFIGGKAVLLGSLFGLIAVAASFLVLGNYLKNSLRYDFAVPTPIAALVATVAPIAFFLLGVQQFIAVLDVVGAISLGAVEGVLIVLIFYRAKTRGNREPEYSVRVPRVLLVFIALLLLLGAGVKVGSLVGLFS